MYSRTGAGSAAAINRSARPNARRRSARATHAGSGCNHAPLPRARRRGSGRIGIGRPATCSGRSAVTRSNSVAVDRWRQPIHVRITAGAARTAVGGLTAIDQSTPPRRSHSPPVRARCRSAITTRVAHAANRSPLHHRRTRRRSGCRCASRSAGRPGARSVPRVRSPGTADSQAPRPWPPSPPDPRR
jgi:hypothetical protein